MDKAAERGEGNTKEETDRNGLGRIENAAGWPGAGFIPPVIYHGTGGMANDAEQLVIAPTSETPIGTVVFVHGLGQLRESWMPTVERLAERLPGVRWVLPQAPNRPVTYNEGRYRPSWFDIANLPPCDCYDETGIAASVASIESLMLSEIHDGTESSKVVLVGFSQGAALCLMVALTTLHDLGGVASLSGWIPRQSRQTMIQMEPNLPVFWGHGNSDHEVPLHVAEECVSFLRDTLDLPDERLVFKTYEGLEHTVSEAEMDDLADWLLRVLA
ncbi:Acyl-protein thioesterase 1 [Grifola frondosa]|uniref:Acyl-protein thioesterase 1 n=1 Tax=Grifola frondosa TaxID=5627 RepID=A0A1C7MTV0_GRIFR|nr:Acyl-protein thioesterase 1 [Grifola frondosa]